MAWCAMTPPSAHRPAGADAAPRAPAGPRGTRVRAAGRWIRADVRAHGGQGVLTAGIIAVVVAWLVLAGMLLRGANSPWAVLHDRTHGADVTVYLAHGTPTGVLATLPGIQEASAPAL